MGVAAVLLSHLPMGATAFAHEIKMKPRHRPSDWGVGLAWGQRYHCATVLGCRPELSGAGTVQQNRTAQVVSLAVHNKRGAEALCPRSCWAAITPVRQHSNCRVRNRSCALRCGKLHDSQSWMQTEPRN